MADITLERITKVYPNGFEAVKALELHVDDGEFLVLVGPSGCGKSTVLRMVAGLERITDGVLRIGERDVTDLAPKDRDIAMVFQNYALYPHMDVGENIAFPLKLRRRPKTEIAGGVDTVARTLQLTEQLRKTPAQLSGGQRQRVAMGRAIIREPEAFLMDEPLSNLDAKLRVQMRADIAAIQRDLGVTTFYVTHDQTEAMTMGDRVAVIKDGILQQVDRPERLYEHPVNVFVAAFIGSPSMNLFEGSLVRSGGGADDDVRLRIGSQELAVPASVLAARPSLRGRVGETLIVGLRPEDLEDASVVSGVPEERILEVDVEVREALGAETLLHFGIGARTVDSGDPDAMEEIGVGAGSRAVARCSARTTLREGQRARLAVDNERLHFFDVATRQSISS